MANYTEITLDGWRKPASESEEQKISNAITMIKDAINSHPTLKAKNLEIIVQGSYGNNTNIKIDSDIDLCIMLKDTFFTKYREGAKDEDYGFVTGGSDYSDYKNWIIEALIAKFGRPDIQVGNKAIQIKSNTYRVQADVVAAFQYRDYRGDHNNNEKNFTEGIKFYSTSNEEIINYPKLTKANGIRKNDLTSRKYKRLVRLYKRLRNRMKDEKIAVPEGMSSYFIEGLLYNVPNRIFNSCDTWNALLRETIIYLYNDTKEDSKCSKWVTVSERYYLFHFSYKWSREQANSFLVQLWNYLGYKA